MKRRRLTKRVVEETRRLEEPIRGGESRSDPMEDERGVVEEKKANETKQGGGGRQTGAGNKSGRQHI